jgi:ATP/ADP translocase
LTGGRDPVLIFVGISAILIGLFFFGFTLGYLEWGEMGRLCPVFPFIGGVAFLAMFLADRAHDAGVMGVGLRSTASFAVFGALFRAVGRK